MTPSWSRRCDLGEPTWFSFISWSVSAIRRGDLVELPAAGVQGAKDVQVVLRRRGARQDRRLFLGGLEGREELGPLGPLADQDLVKELVDRDHLQVDDPRPADLRPSGAAILGLGLKPEDRADRRRGGLEVDVVPSLVIEDDRRAGGQAATARSAWSRWVRLFPSAWLVRSIWRRRAASPRSSVAAMVSGIVATGVTWPPTPWARSVTRGSRSFSRPSDRNDGLESRPVPSRGELDLQGRRLAERPAGGERLGVEAVELGGRTGMHVQAGPRRSAPNRPG